MITAKFYRKSGVLNGFSVSGHAEYADEGMDVVCASVTSAVEMTANGITEVLKAPAAVDVFENEIRCRLSENNYPEAVAFLEALRLHLGLISEDYGEFLHVKDLEV